MEDRAVLEALCDAERTAAGVVLATVVRTRGSVPRHPGSRMLIDPRHGMIGTIGGGCGEAEVIEAATEVLRTRTPRLIEVRLMDSVESMSPAVCGGVMEIFVEPVLGGAA